MLATTNDEMASSLAAFNELRCEGRRLSFAEPSAKTIRIDLHFKEPSQIAYLARMVAHTWGMKRLISEALFYGLRLGEFGIHE
jgi:hypothetical protein